MILNRNQIADVVLAVIATVLKTDVNLNSSRQDTTGWDSIKHVEIVFAIEDELGIEFSEEEMATLNSVTEIVKQAGARYAA